MDSQATQKQLAANFQGCSLGHPAGKGEGSNIWGLQGSRGDSEGALKQDMKKEVIRASKMDDYDVSEEEDEIVDPKQIYEVNSAENLRIKTFFERYIISNEVLGEGGQAFVAKGIDVEKQMYVAIKIYVKASMSDDEVHAARNEKFLAGGLSH